MPNITAVAGGTSAMNLALTGINVREVSDPKDAEKLVDELLQDKLDVLIIEERIRDMLSERAQERLTRHTGSPLLVYCPSFEEEETDVDAYLSSVIKPAVGFEIRLV